jgi:hypothetical protein
VLSAASERAAGTEIRETGCLAKTFCYRLADRICIAVTYFPYCGPARFDTRLKDMALKSKNKGATGDEDDGESDFMPLDEILRKLKAGPLNFGIYQTGDKDNPCLFAAHKRRAPMALAKKAKKDAGTNKGAFGFLTLDSDELTFQCENEDPPASLKKRIRVMLKNAGYAKFKPRIVLPGGAELGDEDDDEGDDDILGPGGAATDEDEQEAKKEEAHKALIDRAGALENDIYDSGLDETNPGLLQDLQKARGAAHDEEFDQSAEMLDKVEKDLAKAKSAAKQGKGGKDDALKEEVEAKWAEVEAMLSMLAGAGAGKIAGQATKLMTLMQTTMKAGDYKKAKAAMVVVDRFIENALEDFGDIDAGGGAGSPDEDKPTGGSAVGGGGGGAVTTDPGRSPPPVGKGTPAAGQPPSGTVPIAPPPKPLKPAPVPPASGTTPGKDYANGAPPVTADENARLAALSPEELAKTDLTIGDTKALFSHDYMMKLKDAPIKGEGNPKLKDLMREIEKDVSGPRRIEVMQALSLIVGVPPTAEKLDLDYGRFLVVREQQKTRGKAKKADVPPLDEGMHPDFRGSRSQLMFGKVLGDAFGIHEVFAALLSPTGGLVGPGNWLIEPGNALFEEGIKAGHLDPDNPVALHGTVHDAAGYLATFHGEGPGYNYRDSDIEFLGTDDPLSGQISGIAYWLKETGVDFAGKLTDEAIAELEKRLKPIRDAVEAEIDQRIDDAKSAAEKAIEMAKQLAEEAEETVVDVATAIKDASAKLEESAVEAIKTAAEEIGDVAEEAKKKLEAAWDFIWN